MCRVRDGDAAEDALAHRVRRRGGQGADDQPADQREQPQPDPIASCQSSPRVAVG